MPSSGLDHKAIAWRKAEPRLAKKFLGNRKGSLLLPGPLQYGTKSMDLPAFSVHIETSLAPVLPPRNPLLRENWSGLAFDRNRYEDLAPEEVWSALFECHIEKSPEPGRIGIISVTGLMEGKDGLQIPADFVALKDYWVEGLKFLSDHFVFSLSLEWIVRLDQDVSLFSGDAAFINAMMAKLGGRNRVIAMMVDDFSPGQEDKAGLKHYIEEITRNSHCGKT